MTKTQIKFYNLITKQIIDFDVIFHKDFIIQRLEKITDEKLKYLLENINIDQDKIVNKKGYTTYAKFAYYADKMINEKLELQLENKISRVDELYNKRAILIDTIDKQSSTMNERLELIENLKTKKLMFKNDNGKSILDSIDYFIIEQFGFNEFFDINKNYKVKDLIQNYLKQYYKQQELPHKNGVKYLQR
ncbi:MAG: hypothetical protein U9R37_00005 [Campylobacterota bacterium]|nr:hypothetical protein [Campylobacterota bacterium]